MWALSLLLGWSGKVAMLTNLYVQSTLNVLILKRIGPFAYKFGDTLKRNVSQQYMKYPMRYCER